LNNAKSIPGHASFPILLLVTVGWTFPTPAPKPAAWRIHGTLGVMDIPNLHGIGRTP
jgi:hypothetical protein